MRTVTVYSLARLGRFELLLSFQPIFLLLLLTASNLLEFCDDSIIRQPDDEIRRG